MRKTVVGAIALCAALGCCVLASSAAAAAPWWNLDSFAAPASLPPAGQGTLVVRATNLGDSEVDGSGTPVTLRDTLPAGVVATSAKGFAGTLGSFVPFRGPMGCTVVSGSLVECTFAGKLPPYEALEAHIGVEVTAGASGGLNELDVSGGGAAPATVQRPVSVSAVPTKYGLATFEQAAYNEDGSLDTQAGSHPYALTTTLDFNRSTLNSSPALPKDLRFDLPPGLIGNPTPFPQCSAGQFAKSSEKNNFANECPEDTALGVATVAFREPTNKLGPEALTLSVPLFNLAPSAGEPAKFGFVVLGDPVVLDTSVRTGGDYGVTVDVKDVPESVAFLSSQVTFWGVPGAPIHDQERGWECISAGIFHIVGKVEEGLAPCTLLSQTSPPSLLSLPTSCTGPLQTTMQTDSWAQPGLFTAPLASVGASLDSCNRLGFKPSIKVTPDGSAGSSPTGLNVDVQVPQTATLDPHGVAESAVKDITVALPQGVAINPAGGDGLQACSEGLAGFTGLSELASLPGVQTATFTERLPDPLAPGVNFCPDASKIGTAKVKTPILPNPIEGAVYLATQNENPFGSLLAMYLVAEDPVSGVLVKLAGSVHLGEDGQITATFQNSPQAPFEDAELHFFGGERAPLSSPAHCGPYTTNATFAPWSGNQPVEKSSTFDITSGPNGSPCPGASLPFSPSLTGGLTNINAGSFSPLTTTIGREDGQQDMQSVQLHMPAGVEGLLSGVKLCGEAQANEGTCGPESEIGQTTVSAGVGNDPVSVTGGRVYITEHYAGAPFGLSIVNPVKAGPFDLEHDTANPAQNPACDCVVVRAKIDVDPHTAALTITTDPSGPRAIPHMIDGIPVQIKRVNVLINREHFTFNPTNCNHLSLTGTIASDEGASSPAAVPFQATNCAVLGFKPKFKVSTSGKTSKANGASLNVKLTYPKAPFGSQANIAKVKVDLPKQLPSRLTTLQKACTAAQFESNPAGCPAASIVGHAKATTPLLPVPLIGPAYFVSHGGEAFPSLIIVLQGYGVTVDLVGTTFISKKGITSSTFKSVPDVPVGSFELNLPQGKTSALAANGNLCKSKLAMPTAFVAQNGTVLHQSTKIAVTGCPKHHKHHKKKKGKKKG